MSVWSTGRQYRTVGRVGCDCFASPPPPPPIPTPSRGGRKYRWVLWKEINGINGEAGVFCFVFLVFCFSSERGDGCCAVEGCVRRAVLKSSSTNDKISDRFTLLFAGS